MTEETRALSLTSGTVLVKQATEMSTAMAAFLPGGSTLPEATRNAMAMLAIKNGLDPFLGEVYAIPQKRKNDRTGAWEVVGYTLGIGRGGWLRNAERSGDYSGHRFRWLTPEETKAMKIVGDDLGVCCVVNKANRTGRGSCFEIEGFGIVRADEQSKMDHYKLARKRAFVDALRNAFPMQIPTGMQVRIVDEDSGEILGNGHEPAVPQAAASLSADLAEYTETPAPAASEAAPQAEPMPWDGDETPEPQAVVTPAAAPERWGNDPKKVDAFFRACKDTYIISPASALAVLGVKTLKDFAGTPEQALGRIANAQGSK